MRVDVVPALAEHVEPIASQAREADRRELWALARATPGQCLRYGLAHSRAVFTGRVDGEPVCMFGATPRDLLLGIGVPWMVGTDRLRSWPAQKALLSLSRPCVEAMRAEFPHLVNVVHGDNAAAIRWLRWLGFSIHPAQPYGPDREPFHLFTLGF